LRTTQEQREAEFQRYLESTVEYNAAIVAAGREPWHGGDIEARRERFFRRWVRPAPPVGLFTDLAVIRGEANKWQPVPIIESNSAA
jgi:hypothetical protein